MMQGLSIFNKENGGLGSARNYDICKSVGEFILPLDSDNKKRPNFIKNALKIFESKSNIGLAYDDAMRFGQENSIWNMGGFNVGGFKL